MKKIIIGVIFLIIVVGGGAVGTGIAYGQGGESTINGTSKDDEKKNLLSGLVLGVPVNRRTGLKFAYFHNQARAATGVDFDTLTGAVSVLW